MQKQTSTAGVKWFAPQVAIRSDSSSAHTCNVWFNEMSGNLQFISCVYAPHPGALLGVLCAIRFKLTTKTTKGGYCRVLFV